MRRNFTRARDRDRMRQQRTPAVAVVADPNRDSCEPCQQRCFKRVLQQDGAVEAFAAKLRGCAPLPRPIPPAARGGVGDDAIAPRLARVQVSDPWPRQYDDLGIGESVPDRPDRRKRHHGIAYPVGRAHQDFGIMHLFPL
jgi:hypothetical protein